MFHAANTEAQVERLVSLLCGWAQEMLDIEAQGPKAGGAQIPSAARQVYRSLGVAQKDDVARAIPEETLAANTSELEPELSVGHSTSSEEDTAELGVPEVPAVLEAPCGLEEKAGETRDVNKVQVAEMVS